MLKNFLKRNSVLNGSKTSADKYGAETSFWMREIDTYKKWYQGEIEIYWGTKTPLDAEKIITENVKDSAILTFHKQHQQYKYLYDLKVDENIFNNKRILDIGAGPMPSAMCFKGADLYCLDPLIDEYLKVGFPIHYYENVKFVHAYSENIPLTDGFFDAVISVNALDHVDDFEKTAAEIKRVLKKDGRVIFHLHFHPPTETEPLELNDEKVLRAFAGINNFRKINESKEKFGSRCADNEIYSLWTNAE